MGHWIILKSNPTAPIPMDTPSVAWLNTAADTVHTFLQCTCDKATVETGGAKWSDSPDNPKPASCLVWQTALPSCALAVMINESLKRVSDDLQPLSEDSETMSTILPETVLAKLERIKHLDLTSCLIGYCVILHRATMCNIQCRCAWR